jgi:hypothetical protein
MYKKTIFWQKKKFIAKAQTLIRIALDMPSYFMMSLWGGQNPHQDRLGHAQLLHDVPLGNLGPPELDASPPGTSIKVFVDCRHCEKALAQMTKTTFFK